jgi:mRNA interferase HigB
MLVWERVRVISKRGLFHRSLAFRDARTALQVWLETAKAATWQSIEDIRKTFPSADMAGRLVIFNIKGNHYRLIVRMEFRSQRIYIKEFLTHAEYDKGAWRKWL